MLLTPPNLEQIENLNKKTKTEIIDKPWCTIYNNNFKAFNCNLLKICDTLILFKTYQISNNPTNKSKHQTTKILI
jgi:hypothetical protein